MPPKPFGTIIGREALIKKFRRLEVEMTKEIRKEIAVGSLLIESEMKRRVQRGPKTGRVYFKKAGTGGGETIGSRVSFRGGTARLIGKLKAGGFHRASAPGEAPATDSGTLVAHIAHFITERGLRGTIGVFASDSEEVSSYAKWLEHGTRLMAARPFVRPSFRKHRKRILERIVKAAKKASRRLRSQGKRGKR
tara:strand:+ start:2354 stop:2932 length:579 start_codon:yes stop_codon:yes gene_type:complete